MKIGISDLGIDDALYQPIVKLKPTLETINNKLDETLTYFYSANSNMDATVHGLSGATIPVADDAKYNYIFNTLYPENGAGARSITSLLSTLEAGITAMQEMIISVKEKLAALSPSDAVTRFQELSDTPDLFFNNQFLQVDASESYLENETTLIPESTFLSMTDTPNSYIDESNNVIVQDQGMGFASLFSFLPHKIYKIYAATLIDLDLCQHNVVLLYRDGAPYTVTLGATVDGAHLYIISNELTGYGEITIDVDAGLSLEDGPITINDTNRFLHLYYDDTNATYRIMNYE